MGKNKYFFVTNTHIHIHKQTHTHTHIFPTRAYLWGSRRPIYHEMYYGSRIYITIRWLILSTHFYYSPIFWFPSFIQSTVTTMPDLKTLSRLQIAQIKYCPHSFINSEQHNVLSWWMSSIVSSVCGLWMYTVMNSRNCKEVLSQQKLTERENHLNRRSSLTKICAKMSVLPTSTIHKWYFVYQLHFTLDLKTTRLCFLLN